jgi:hypothetical protein
VTCANCDSFGARLEIRLPGELARVLAAVKRAVAAGRLRYDGFESSRVLIGQPDFGSVDPTGPYPDVLDYYFECPACGAVFELTAETYHGSGGRWVRLRAPGGRDVEPDINHVLRVYLGAGADGGYEPLYHDERMRQVFPETYPRLMEVIAPYLDADQTPDFSNADLDLLQEAGRFAAALRRRFPELEDATIKALADRWHFGWSR